MLQIRRFALPTEEAAANTFLATHKPDQVSFFADAVVIGHDDGIRPIPYQIVELRELVQAAEAAQIQQSVAKGVLEHELVEIVDRRDKAVTLSYSLDKELGGIDKKKDHDGYNTKKHELASAKEQVDQLNKEIDAKIDQVKSVAEAMRAQDSKVKVIKAKIAELESVQ